MAALRLVLVLFALASAAAAAAPATLAMLPISGEGLSTVELQELDKIDLALRDALLLRDEVTVQPREQTESSFKSTLDAGVRCKSTELPCLAKVALLAEVTLLVVPVARPATDGRYEVELALVEVETGRADRASSRLPTSGKAVDIEAKKLVDQVFLLRTRPTVAPVANVADVAPAPAPVVAAAPAPAPTAPPVAASAAAPEPASDGTVWWVAGGVGAAVVVTGLVIGAVALAGGGNGLLAEAPVAPPVSGPAVVELP